MDRRVHAAAVIALLIGLGVGLGGTFLEGADGTCDLVAHYRMDAAANGTVPDASPMGNDLHLSGASLTDGPDGGALSLRTGSAEAAEPLPLTDDAFTITFWLRPGPVTGSIIELPTGDGYPRLKIRGPGTDGRLWWSLWKHAERNTNPGTVRTRWNASRWYHVAIQHVNNTRDWRVYIDGVLDYSGDDGDVGGIRVPVWNDGLVLGEGNENPDFAAALADVRVYDRELGPAEIRRVMDGSGPCQG